MVKIVVSKSPLESPTPCLYRECPKCLPIAGRRVLHRFKLCNIDECLAVVKLGGSTAYCEYCISRLIARVKWRASLFSGERDEVLYVLHEDGKKQDAIVAHLKVCFPNSVVERRR